MLPMLAHASMAVRTVPDTHWRSCHALRRGASTDVWNDAHRAGTQSSSPRNSARYRDVS